MRGSRGHPFLVDVVVNHDRSSRRSDALLWTFVAHLARKTCNPYSVGSVKNTQTPTFLRLTGNDSSQPFRMISLAFKIHRKSTAWNSCISLDFSTIGFTPLCDESKQYPRPVEPFERLLDESLTNWLIVYQSIDLP